MARFLVTGANGFAGPYVAEALAARGHEIVGMARHPSLNSGTAISRWVHAELADGEGVRRAVAEARPDGVVHLAAISFVAHSDIAGIYATNIVGTRNLLDALSNSRGFAGPFLFASSANVYGSNTGGALHEDLPPSPQNDYAISKLAAEHVVRSFAGRLQTVIMRPFNYLGVGQSAQFIVPKIVDHLKRRAPVIELGNIDVARDFSDVRFFAECVARLADQPDAIGSTVNICSGQARSLRDVLAIGARLAGHTMDIRVNPAFVRANEVHELWGDPKRLHSLIGHPEAPSLEATLQWMLNA